MANDPLERLKTDLDESVPGVEPLGMEANPGGGERFLVADVPESDVDEAAALAEEQGLDDISFEPSPEPGRETLRFGKDR